MNQGKTMKCLSLWQPWASLMVHGNKRIETRGWPITHRGTLLIHAAKKWDAELERLSKTEPFKSALVANGSHPDFLSLPRGAILGSVELVRCLRTEDMNFAGPGADYCPFGSGSMWHGYQAPETECPFGDYTPGRFAFVCQNPVVFAEPIPFRGMQGLFNVPEELVRLTANGVIDGPVPKH